MERQRQKRSTYSGRGALVEFAGLLELFVQLAEAGVLEYDVDATLVVEPAVHAQNVRVSSTSNHRSSFV